MCYIVYSLPRTMSTWMSHFLYERDHPCYHEKSQEFPSVNTLAMDMIHRQYGVCDTGLILLHKKIEYYQIPTVLILRDYKEVWEELENLKIPLTDRMKRGYLEAIDSYPGVVIPFKELQTKDGVRQLCTHISVPFDEVKYEEFKDTQIQPFVPPMVARVKKNLQFCKELYKDFI